MNLQLQLTFNFACVTFLHVKFNVNVSCFSLKKFPRPTHPRHDARVSRIHPPLLHHCTYTFDISLSEDSRSSFYTDFAILLGVYEQILEQLGHRPCTGPLGCIYYLMQYILDVGCDPMATFSHTILWSYMPPWEPSFQPMSNITQVRDLSAFQLQLQRSIDSLHQLKLLFDDDVCAGIIDENIVTLEDVRLFI